MSAILAPNGRLALPRVARLTFLVDIPAGMNPDHVDLWLRSNLTWTDFIRPYVQGRALEIGTADITPTKQA